MRRVYVVTWEQFGWPTALRLQAGVCLEADQKRSDGKQERKIRQLAILAGLFAPPFDTHTLLFGGDALSLPVDHIDCRFTSLIHHPNTRRQPVPTAALRYHHSHVPSEQLSAKPRTPRLHHLTH
ncbi:hypothetical protein VTJ04DRAFT_9245 [Mycothermus thermophilus]|uniref:uncharacterized protein n=1 Tax=Humicola insolens TaxID=85995 RepID=UPI0037440E65